MWRTWLHTVFVCTLREARIICMVCLKLSRAAIACQNSSTCVCVSDCGSMGISPGLQHPPTHTLTAAVWNTKKANYIDININIYINIYTKLIFWSVFSFFKYCGTSCALFFEEEKQKRKKSSMSLFGLSFLFDYFFSFSLVHWIFCSALWNHKLVLIILPDCVLYFDFKNFFDFKESVTQK